MAEKMVELAFDKAYWKHLDLCAFDSVDDSIDLRQERCYDSAAEDGLKEGLLCVVRKFVAVGEGN